MTWKEYQPLQQAIQTAEATMGDTGRILVRASGTEPVIRVMVEAQAAEVANYWTNELVLQLQKYIAV
jgi:phosphoglucosamine mutase (EC 5.4.2.10)